MNYYFFNTDANSMGGQRRFHILIQGGFAATSGPRKFGEQFEQLAPDDKLLMYENRLGVVAVGTVLERWDRQSHTPLYFLPNEHDVGFEYRIRVKWFLDRSDNPVTLKQLTSRNIHPPRGAIRRIVKRRPEVEMLIGELQSALTNDSFFSSSENASDIQVLTDESSFEGRELLQAHRSRERNRTLVRRKKRQVLAAEGKLLCEVCTFDFAATYGELGKSFAECHHTRPLAELRVERNTRLSELAVVCANCHRMLHRHRLHSVAELRAIVQARRATSNWSVP